LKKILIFQRRFDALRSREPTVKPARCQDMHSNEQRESFLAKALEAEKEAAAALQPQLREIWLKLAATYRALSNSGGDKVATPREE